MCTTRAPAASSSTGYGVTSSCFWHSTTPMRACFSSSNARSVKGSVGYLLFTSLKRYRDAFILRRYVLSTARLYTVVRCSECLGFPSPVLRQMSTLYTSLVWNSAVSTFIAWSRFPIITLLPSMTNRFIWWLRVPSTMLTLNAPATASHASVTSWLVLPCRISLVATCSITLAQLNRFPSSPANGRAALGPGPSAGGHFIESATTTMKPSTCTPRSIFTMSPALMSCGEMSEARGQLWHTTSFTDTHVGNAIPFSMAAPFTFFW
mmetsp:Transcript_44588/g.82554  ORF Transcript_44588/g.82554 Transcript_44588/m.82554 type:complete len:264 (-) Transcript_44588:276-1067(-)